LKHKDIFKELKKFPQLDTKKLILREIKPPDAKDLFCFMSDEEALKYNLTPIHKTIEETKKQIKYLKKLYEKRRRIL